MNRFLHALSIVLALALVSGFMAMACTSGESEADSNGDGDASATDGDSSATDGDIPFTDGDTPDAPDGDTSDGDTPTDGDTTDGDQTWTDDTADRWTWPPFCGNSSYMLAERFDDGNITSSPAWGIDSKVDGAPTGSPSEVAVPHVTGDDIVQGKYLSGRPADTGSDLPTARLYVTMPNGVESWSFMSRLPDGEGTNLFWLNNDNDPTGTWIPEIRIFHEADAENGPENQSVRIVEQTGMSFCDPPATGLSSGWHRIDLYRNNGKEWRMDVDRVTVCEFTKTTDSDRPLTHAFIGLDGYLDDIFFDNCGKPAKGIGCAADADCPSSQVCGRDGSCYAIRAQTCISVHQCSEGTTCLGEKADGALLGDGTCTITCKHHADCSPVEFCFPRTFEGGYCQQACPGGGACPEDQTCRQVFGIEACLPDRCKDNAEWRMRESGLLACECTGDYTLDPFDLDCEDNGTCNSTMDCRNGYICAGNRCWRNRDIPCDADTDCTDGSSCFAFILDDDYAEEAWCMQQSCINDDDCLAYERCLGLHSGGMGCVQVCDSSSDCEIGWNCIETDAAGFCAPAKCQANGEWAWDAAGASMTCRCTGSATPDPFTGRCL